MAERVDMKKVIVRPGALEVARKGSELVTFGLGSCVCVALHDDVAGVGGMSHCLLPEPLNDAAASLTGRYVRTAVPALVAAMEAAGARLDRTRAWLTGGASMFPALSGPNGEGIGTRNVASAREELARLGLRVHGEACGGHHGRTVRLVVGEGRLIVRSVYDSEVVL